MKHLEDHKYYIFFKPYNVLNQFSKESADHVTLADYLNVASDVYPIGRLDKDSEGLLIMTNDKALNNLLLHPSRKHQRSYFVQLDNEITDKAIALVSNGVQIKLETSIYHTSPCSVKKLPKAPLLPERNPPVRFRKDIPTSWALITLSEGKNRQVRKMFSAVGFPVLRLVRVQIENLKIGKLQPGESMEIKGAELYKLLNIDPQESIKKRPAPRTKTISKTKPAVRRSGKKTAVASKAEPKVKNVVSQPKKQEDTQSAKTTRKWTDKKSSSPSSSKARSFTEYRKKK